MCGFIAQLVEHRTGIAEVTGSNPVEAQAGFFRLFLSSCLNWKIYCDDHTSLSPTTAVQIWIISYKLQIINFCQRTWHHFVFLQVLEYALTLSADHVRVQMSRKGRLLIIIIIIIYMKKLLDSDWMRAVQFKCNTSAKSVTPVQIAHRNSGLWLVERK